MNLQARLYDPVIGRFLSVDPLAEIQIGITPYHYCGNDPINAKDPSGLLLSSKVLEEIEYEKRTSHERLMRVISSLNRWDLEAIAMRQQVRNGMMHDLENYRDLADGGANSAYTDLFNSTNYVADGLGGSFICEYGPGGGGSKNTSRNNYRGYSTQINFAVGTEGSDVGNILTGNYGLAAVTWSIKGLIDVVEQQDGSFAVSISVYGNNPLREDDEINYTSWVEVFKDGALYDFSSVSYDPNAYYQMENGYKTIGSAYCYLPPDGLDITLVVSVKWVISQNEGNAISNNIKSYIQHFYPTY